MARANGCEIAGHCLGKKGAAVVLKVGLHRAREDAADALQFVDDQNRPVPRSRMSLHAAPTVSSPAMMIGFRSRTIYPRGRFVMVRAISSSAPVINDTDQLTRVLHRSGVALLTRVNAAFGRAYSCALLLST
jgi:hypothetical protein